MQIRKVGPQPHEQFSMLPNAALRDSRLSYRARGVLAYINSHADGFHINADRLAAEGTEGRDALRTAMNELVDCNYLRRVRRQDEKGQWRTDMNIYIYGDGPPIVGTEDRLHGEVTDEDFTDEEPPTTDFQASVAQSSIEHQSEDSSTFKSSLVDGDPTTEVPVEEPGVSHSVTPGIDEKENYDAAPIRPLPVVYQRLLSERHGVTKAAQQEAWQMAWTSAEQIKGDVDFQPYDHLAVYLTGCTQNRHPANAQRWLEWFIRDRSKHIAALADDADRRARDEETPQEREDRYNRRLPPITTLTFCPGCGAEPTTEPHREGCHRAAATTGEKS